MKVYTCCGHDTVVKRIYCPSCGTSNIQEQEISDHGTIYSFTKIHVPPVEFAEIAPYNVVLVKLMNTTAKVTGRLMGDVSIGDNVELDRVENGAYLYKKV